MQRFRLVSAFLAFLGAAAGAESPTLRLPNVVTPIRYSADLTLRPSRSEFTGQMRIDVKVNESTKAILLNAAGMEFSRAMVEAGGHSYTAQPTTNGGQLRLSLADSIPAGDARITLDFDGKLDTRASSGLFRVREGGDDYIFSQMEPIDARRAFPCFDEPAFKTPWQLTLHVPRDLTAVSNTPVVSENPEQDGMKAVHFAESKPLPSYLIAIGVGPFDVVDAGKAGRNQTPIRIITPKGKAGQARFAAEITGSILERLEDYFDIPYPFEKLDSLAIPLTYGFSAMENAGLITYGQTLLLSDPAQDNIARQRGYVSVATHEIAHQWFGDLVTMEWWNDIWLNEAFATWMQRKILAEWKPEWGTRISEQSNAQGAMSLDALASARRIRQPIETEDDISNSFDGITYQKGAAVIRMFENWAGPQDFRLGIQRYLKAHAGGAASAGDFLDAVSTAAKKDVASAFSTFLEQEGVPMVTVDIECEGGPALKLSQSRALPVGSTGSTETAWKIPLCVRYPGKSGSVERECFVLSEAQATIRLNRASGCPAWVQANDQGAGYYRVRYASRLLDALQSGGNLTPAEKVNLIGDVNFLARAGLIPAADGLALAQKFAADPQRQVVQATVGAAASIYPELTPEDLRPNYVRFLQRAYGDRARSLGWTARAGEIDDDALLRSSLVPLMAGLGEDEGLRMEAARLADQWLTERKGVDPNMVGGVLEVTASHGGGRAFFDRLAKALSETEDRRERSLLFGALGSFLDPAIVKDSLKLLLTPGIDLREASPVLFGPVGRPGVSEEPLQFVQANWAAVVARMPTGTSFDFGSRLPSLAAGYCSAEEARKVSRYFERRMVDFSGGPRQLTQTLERIRLCAARKDAQQSSVAEFLSQYQ